MLLKNSENMPFKSKGEEFISNTYNSHRGTTPKETKCSFCGEIDHVVTIANKGKSIVNYFACKMFVEMIQNNDLMSSKT